MTRPFVKAGKRHGILPVSLADAARFEEPKQLTGPGGPTLSQ